MNRIAIIAAALLPAMAGAQQKEVDELLAADRAYSAAAAKTDVITGLMAMFSPKVVMPTPQGKFADGIDAVTEALKANPANLQSKVEWNPIRGGISGDGQHGFTFGYMTLRPASGGDILLKYLAYWIKESGTWKVAAYKRSRPQPGDSVLTPPLAPSLPARIVAPSTDVPKVAEFSKSLADAEQSFSDEAGKIGLGPAFEKFGRSDAMNMGARPAFTLGNVAIANDVSGPAPATPSRLAWKSDHGVMVASSGDLGISIGFIHDTSDPSRAPFPFFTIWRRDSPAAPWRYIAE
jgi:ketosteroid isomerase-like protein